MIDFVCNMRYENNEVAFRIESVSINTAYKKAEEVAKEIFGINDNRNVSFNVREMSVGGRIY